VKEEQIIKIINGEGSPDEIKKAREWLNDPGHNKDFETKLLRKWEKTIDTNTEGDSNRRYLLNKIHDSIHKTDTQEKKISLYQDIKINFNYYLKIAASILIGAFSIIYTSTYLSKSQSDTVVDSTIPSIIRETGIGEKMRLTLTDGTLITLNSGSSIQFPEKFTENERVVELTGEAFFEVKHDVSRPFKVIVGAMETTVLGTKFNVKEVEHAIMVTLTEGRVRVGLTDAEKTDAVELLPGQMAYSDISDKKVHVEEVNVQEITAWKDGVIAIRNLPLKDVAAKLENWYGVTISIDQSIDKEKVINGEFNNENLFNILSGLAFSLEFQYSMNNKEVEIKK
jgi:transmembrane sensor